MSKNIEEKIYSLSDIENIKKKYKNSIIELEKKLIEEQKITVYCKSGNVINDTKIIDVIFKLRYFLKIKGKINETNKNTKMDEDQIKMIEINKNKENNDFLNLLSIEDLEEKEKDILNKNNYKLEIHNHGLVLSDKFFIYFENGMFCKVSEEMFYFYSFYEEIKPLLEDFYYGTQSKNFISSIAFYMTYSNVFSYCTIYRIYELIYHALNYGRPIGNILKAILGKEIKNYSQYDSDHFRENDDLFYIFKKTEYTTKNKTMVNLLALDYLFIDKDKYIVALKPTKENIIYTFNRILEKNENNYNFEKFMDNINYLDKKLEESAMSNIYKIISTYTFKNSKYLYNLLYEEEKKEIDNNGHVMIFIKFIIKENENQSTFIFCIFNSQLILEDSTDIFIKTNLNRNFSKMKKIIHDKKIEIIDDVSYEIINTLTNSKISISKNPNKKIDIDYIDTIGYILKRTIIDYFSSMI